MQQHCMQQLELFPIEKCEQNLSTNEEVQNLGQVFTPDILANFMINLIKDNINSQSKILDPCIGPNTFLNILSESSNQCYMKGFEVDKQLIGFETQKFFTHPKRELINGSFFESPINEKFDFIIENPPYVRQELLSSGINAKTIITNTFSTSMIPAQSNLYVYFLLKSILHLKDKGIMVAVIYDSWLYSSFGNFLKESLLKWGYVESIFHFRKNAFDNIEVGATVIKFIKSDFNNKDISYYTLENLSDIKRHTETKKESINIKQKELLTHSFNNQSLIQTSSFFFKSLKSVSSTTIQRGTSAIINNYFIFSNKIYSESIPIIKDVSKIKTYTVPTKENAYILAINNSISSQTMTYIDSVKEQILNTPLHKFKAVKRMINSNQIWYKVKLKACSNFIFNYYLRNNIDFIYNPDKKYSSDNFYLINIKAHVLCYLAILNSSFTKISVLNNSRSQGNGLRKIQLYEFKRVKIINAEKLSIASIDILEDLGKALLTLNRYKNEQDKIVKQIDIILLNEYNRHTDSSLKLEELQNEIKDYYK